MSSERERGGVVLVVPWLSLVSIIWLQAISSTNTDFPAYSTLLKSRLDITQVQLNDLAVASDAGKLFGFLAGIVGNIFPLWSVLAVGSTIGLFGYGIQYLFLIHKIATLSYWQFVLLQVLAGNSICWFNTACYLAAMRKFPLHSGVVIGLAASYTGLTAKIYVAMATILSDDSDKSVYLLLNCAVPIGLGILTAPFVLESKKPATRGNGTGLLLIFLIACGTGVYAVAQTLVPALATSRSVVPPAMLLVMVGMVAMVPLLRAVETVLTARDNIRVGNHQEVEEKGGSGVAAAEVEDEIIIKKVVDEIGVKELVRNVDFWLYFAVYMSGATMGLVFGNNLGQIAQSGGVQESILVSVYSSFSFFGKLSSAALSALSSKYMLPRPAYVAIVMVPMSSAFFLLLTPNTSCLFVSTAIIGACSGAITSIAISMTCDLFGRQNFSVNHNVVVGNIPIGSLLFGYMAARIYDKQESADGLCIGPRCYRKTFMIWGSTCTLGTILSIVLYTRTRKCLSSAK